MIIIWKIKPELRKLTKKSAERTHKPNIYENKLKFAKLISQAKKTEEKPIKLDTTLILNFSQRPIVGLAS